MSTTTKKNKNRILIENHKQFLEEVSKTATLSVWNSKFSIKRLSLEADPVEGTPEGIRDIPQGVETNSIIGNSVENDSKSHPILFRYTARHAKEKIPEVRISTTVDSEQLSTFWRDYVDILKGSSQLKLQSETKKVSSKKSKAKKKRGKGAW
ncbi:Hypothetical protein PP7435_CHR4-0320 [Komagataella phaffii CBS 7435]|uniref:Uncharacterized protein n=2 Tax=Komagataella phaffii TaxID=460519 RepID=C4R8I3_KOMPG|nr:Hypothetical protein PAS_chr4_0650 [Komagataella phaffii GS115]CAH2450690.1 Hypothetical protein BQ9382_C4-1675 [Komagataella phaffii CBS 7435]CAY71908.1 Hypothetical protein PAS_chr4_0650 [Komagataella phaffii GS115]CCA40490.1 Hypothetical protein PP7435_CHR4-0320 [Komagataella phaffii CBS 7435]